MERNDASVIVLAVLLITAGIFYYYFSPSSVQYVSYEGNWGRVLSGATDHDVQTLRELQDIFYTAARTSLGGEKKNIRGVSDPATTCRRDVDCVLLTCAGAFNKDYAQTLPLDLPCDAYSGYSPVCQAGVCMPKKQ